MIVEDNRKESISGEDNLIKQKNTDIFFRMLSKGVRNLLSLQKRFIPVGSSSWIVKPQYGLFNNKNNRNDSDEQDNNPNTPEGDIFCLD